VSKQGRPWPERIYGLVVALYPRAFRERYGAPMRLVFRDLLEDSQVPSRRIWLGVLGDLRSSLLREHAANFRGGLSMTRDRLLSDAVIRSGALFGCAVLLIWITFRSFHLFGGSETNPQGWAMVRDFLRLLAPWLLFASAGYVGARAGGTFSGGLKAGLVTGAIASLAIPGDYLLFHMWLPGGVTAWVIVLAACTAVAMFFTAIGAAFARRMAGRGTGPSVFRVGHLTIAWNLGDEPSVAGHTVSSDAPFSVP
jgi:hypothetical protein